jgi:hypothetical protein
VVRGEEENVALERAQVRLNIIEMLNSHRHFKFGQYCCTKQKYTTAKLGGVNCCGAAAVADLGNVA